MANLKDIRGRIGSVTNTQKITKAMKMVSAAKLRRAQDNITNLRPYAQSLLSVIADVASTQRVQHPLLKMPETTNHVLLVIINSDRGLCGGFNANVNKFAENYYHEKKSQYETLDLLVAGRKALDYLTARDIPVKDSILGLAKDISIDVAKAIAEQIMEQFTSGQYDEVQFVYNEFKSAISQERVSERILPVDLSKADLDQSDSRFARDLIFEPEPQQMIDMLLERHFTSQVYRCLCESVAGEHAARMTAMDNATNNAKDLIDNLTLTYNKLRQAAITTEITEICSGAEALKA